MRPEFLSVLTDVASHVDYTSDSEALQPSGAPDRKRSVARDVDTEPTPSSTEPMSPGDHNAPRSFNAARSAATNAHGTRDGDLARRVSCTGVGRAWLSLQFHIPRHRLAQPWTFGGAERRS